MKKLVFFAAFFLFVVLVGHTQQPSGEKIYPRAAAYPNHIPSKKKVWVFILAGQSNMSGRGLVASSDTVADERTLTLDKQGELVLAKEPLNLLLEPKMAELSLGTSFAKRLLQDCPAGVSILLIQTAVGGSSISQWLGDSVHRGVKLYSNFKEKVALAKKYGVIKGVLWHQGEADANERDIPRYQERLTELFSSFRKAAGQRRLPVVLGELGSFSKTPETFARINGVMRTYVGLDRHAALVSTADLMHKGDFLHFNAEGFRLMGQRYAEQFLSLAGR